MTTYEQLSSGGADGIQLPNTKIGFYGATPVAQWRKSTAVQYSSLLATMLTTSGSLFDGTNLATINQAILALQEVMNTLAAHGLWAIS